MRKPLAHNKKTPMKSDKELRDCFAGYALTGIMASGKSFDAKLAAMCAFECAEAMMAERQKRNVAAQNADHRSPITDHSPTR